MGYILYLALLLFVVIGVLIFTVLYYTDNRNKLGYINKELIELNTSSEITGKPYELSVSQGEVSGSTTLYKFGYNPDITNAGGEETIWTPGGDITYRDDAVTVEVLSGSGSDISTGTGARTIKVIGVDGDYNQVEEDITMDGTDVVTGQQTFLRVFRSFVTTAGTSETNTGTITIRSSDDNVTMAEIPLNGGGEGQTQMAVYTVPAGKTLYVNQLTFTASVSGTGNKYATIKLISRDSATKVKRVRFVNVMNANRDTANFKYPLVYPEKTDLECRASSNDDALISASFEGTLIDN